MSFFDSKEEVLQVELTEYGKFLLSRGKFSPKYYSFLDDDILYDSRYANFSESQNNSYKRILYETPIIKPQVNFCSSDKRSMSGYDLTKEKPNITYKLQPGDGRSDIIRENPNYPPLGTSALSNFYYPAWDVNFFSGSIDKINIFTKDAKQLNQFQKTPQIFVSPCICTLTIHEVDADELSPEKEIYTILNNVDVNPPLNENIQQIYAEYWQNQNTIFAQEQKNEKSKSLKNIPIEILDKTRNFFEVSEKNTEDSNFNFDIEVFVEKKVEEKGSTFNIWHPLYFFKKPTNIKNNILLDDYINTESFSIEPDENYVDYYFTLLVDEEIYEISSNTNSFKDIYKSNITFDDKPFGDACE